MSEVSEQQVFAVINKMLDDRLSLSKSLEEQGLSRYRFFKALNQYPKALTEYTRAQQFRSELLVEEIVEIADTELDPQKARNRIDARKWYASKMTPSKYGDRIDVNMTGAIDLNAALSEAKQRVISKRDQAEAIEAELVEPKALLPDQSAGSAPVVNLNPNDSDLPDPLT